MISKGPDPLILGPVSWERMISAVEKVRARLNRAVQAMESAGIPYAVIGGNAVAAWVSRIDESAVRNTVGVDLLIRREDHERASEAMRAAGFIPRHVRGIDMFLDGPDGKVRDAVHILFAGEKVRADSIAPAPDVTECEQDASFRLVSLAALVRMKLTSFRRKDQVHLLDMMDIGLIDPSWCGRFVPELAARLQELIDNPDD